jgi:tetratricopeptide (TPR) repeat protein
MSSIFQQAILSLEQGNLDRAERQFRIVLQDEPEMSIQIMGHLADIALMKDNIHSAIRWQKRSLILSQEMGEIYVEIEVSLRLAALYFRKQDYLTAYHWTEEAFGISEKGWFRQWMAESLVAQARVLAYLGRTGNTIKKSNKHIDPYRESILLLRKSRDIFEEIRDQEGYFRSTLQMGKIFYERQMLSEARKEFLVSLRLLSKDEVLLAASLHLRIAAICRKEKRDVEGIPHALAALGRYKTLQKSSNMDEYQEAQEGFGNSLHAIGSFYRRVGNDVFWAQLHRVLDEQSFDVVEDLILDYLQTFVEEVGQEDGPEAEAFSLELQQKLELQDRTEEIMVNNSHRPLAQHPLTDPKIGSDKKITKETETSGQGEQESSTEFQPAAKKTTEFATEVATEVEEFEFTVPRSQEKSHISTVNRSQAQKGEDNTQVSVKQREHQSQMEHTKKSQKNANPKNANPKNGLSDNPTQTLSVEPEGEHKKNQSERRDEKGKTTTTKKTQKPQNHRESKKILSPKEERTSQVNMVIELDDAVNISLSDEVTNRVEWKEFSKQKDPTPKWKDFLLIAFGIAFVLYFVLNVLR